MAGVTKVNPNPVYSNWEQVGKDITWFEVSATNIPVYVAPGNAATPELDGYQTDGALNALFNVIQATTIIIAAGPVVSAGILSFGVEGVYTGQNNFNGTVDDGDLKRMQDEIRALGATVGAGVSTSEDGTVGAYAGLDFTGVIITPSDLVLAPNGTPIT